MPTIDASDSSDNPWLQKNACREGADIAGGPMDPSILDEYDPASFYCEMLRSAASRIVRERLAGWSINALKQRAAANAELYNLGITFTIYSEAQTID